MALKARDKFIASQAIAQAYPSEIDANGYFVSHPETETDQVSDMTAFMKTLNKQGTDAAAVKQLLDINGGGGVPLASILPWVDDVNTVPAGFLKCDGTAVSRTTYADLFGAIGTKYGSGDGSTTFNVPDLTDAAILNGSYDKTTFTAAGSATFTAPKDGYYKITVKGGGGGGSGSSIGANNGVGGGGGGEGGTTIGYERLNSGNTVTVVVGAGGTGGAGNAPGNNGGDSSVTVGLNTYTGYGGGGGGAFVGGVLIATSTGGVGGAGTIYGAAGGSGDSNYATSNIGFFGGSGGGVGGASSPAPGTDYSKLDGTQGGGGSGGSGITPSTLIGGGNGGDGYVWIEYIGTASQYLIKYTPTVIDSEVSAATSARQSRAAAQAAESYAGSAGIPVGTLFPYAADTQTPPTGFLFCNGQAVSRTMYADLFSVLGTTWGAGDGSTTFNLPTSEDLVLQGASATNPVGTYLSAGLPNIEGQYATNSNVASLYSNGAIVDGAFTKEPTLSDHTYTAGFTSGASTYYDVGFDASESNAIYGASDTVQSPAACVKFIIKAYDGVTPTSAGIDLSQYASDLSNKADRSLSNLDGNGEKKLADTTESVVYEDGFAIIYPNGGTESNPANVTANSRYVEANPFPGYRVYCEAEVFYNNAWGKTGYYISNSSAAFADASQFDDDKIVLQTGTSQLMASSSYANNPFGINSGVTLISAPCRVKVWKVGKVNNA